MTLCPVCGGERLRESARLPDHYRTGQVYHRLSACVECGFRFLSPAPDTRDYPHHFLADGGSVDVSLRWRVYYSLFRRVGPRPPGRLLDVGCGDGKYLAFMAAKGWQACGVDPYAPPTAVSASAFAVIRAELRDASLPPNYFDVITFWWSLEHMADPVPTLTEAFRIVRPGGQLVVGVPNVEALEARLFGPYWFHLNTPVHLSHFTGSSLALALRRAGFTVERLRQDWLSLGLVGSAANWLRHSLFPGITVRRLAWHCLSIPWDLAAAALGSSGLITAYARKPEPA